MMARYLALGQRIQQELEEIETTVDAVRRDWQTGQAEPAHRAAYTSSVALGLHRFYSDLEGVLALFAVEIDGGALGGEAWHAYLLREMALELAEVRPAVLERSTAERLDEYRRFRHLTRNIYNVRLESARVTDLVEQLPQIWQKVQAELKLFIDFLRELARADQG